MFLLQKNLQSIFSNFFFCVFLFQNRGSCFCQHRSPCLILPGASSDFDFLFPTTVTFCIVHLHFWFSPTRAAFFIVTFIFYFFCHKCGKYLLNSFAINSLFCYITFLVICFIGSLFTKQCLYFFKELPIYWETDGCHEVIDPRLNIHLYGV